MSDQDDIVNLLNSDGACINLFSCCRNHGEHHTVSFNFQQLAQITKNQTLPITTKVIIGYISSNICSYFYSFVYTFPPEGFVECTRNHQQNST